MARHTTDRAPQVGCLVINRNDGEAVHIGDAKVTIHIQGKRARLAIEAPRDVKILRDELENRS